MRLKLCFATGFVSVLVLEQASIHASTYIFFLAKPAGLNGPLPFYYSLEWYKKIIRRNTEMRVGVGKEKRDKKKTKAKRYTTQPL